jgi:hypothetical protein
MELKPGDLLIDNDGDLALIVERDESVSTDKLMVIHLTNRNGDKKVKHWWYLFNDFDRFIRENSRLVVLCNTSNLFEALRNELSKKE